MQGLGGLNFDLSSPVGGGRHGYYNCQNVSQNIQLIINFPNVYLQIPQLSL